VSHTNQARGKPR